MPWMDNVEVLTPEQIEELRRHKKEVDAYAKKAFAHLRPPRRPSGDTVVTRPKR